MMKIMTISAYCEDIYDLAAHLDELDGTLVCRGTKLRNTGLRRPFA
jgi:hypothetical protein